MSCSKDQILNPLTHRCVKLNGVIGKRLSRSRKLSPARKPVGKGSPVRRRSSIGGSLPSDTTHHTTSTRSSTKSSTSSNDCYLFNEVHICNTVSVNYHEDQRERLCGLHAVNNFLQNQDSISKPPIVTRAEMDKACSQTQQDPCEKDGNYSNWAVLKVIKKYFPKADWSKSSVAFGRKGVVGCIYLYKAPNCDNHWVTLLPRGENYLVVDSEHLETKVRDPKEQNKVVTHRGNAEVLESQQDVYKYFRKFEGVIVIHK